MGRCKFISVSHACIKLCRSVSHYIYFIPGPDIGGKVGGDSDVDTAAIGTGALAGIIIASILGVAVALAVLVYCIIVFRKKQEEKEAEMSMSTLFPPGMYRLPLKSLAKFSRGHVY